jgi:hypothetical protein
MAYWIYGSTDVDLAAAGPAAQCRKGNGVRASIRPQHSKERQSDVMAVAPRHLVRAAQCVDGGSHHQAAAQVGRRGSGAAAPSGGQHTGGDDALSHVPGGTAGAAALCGQALRVSGTRRPQCQQESWPLGRRVLPPGASEGHVCNGRVCARGAQSMAVRKLGTPRLRRGARGKNENPTRFSAGSVKPGVLRHGSADQACSPAEQVGRPSVD